MRLNPILDGLYELSIALLVLSLFILGSTFESNQLN